MHVDSLCRGELFQAATSSWEEESSKYHFLTECNVIAFLPWAGVRRPPRWFSWLTFLFPLCWPHKDLCGRTRVDRNFWSCWRGRTSWTGDPWCLLQTGSAVGRASVWVVSLTETDVGCGRHWLACLRRHLSGRAWVTAGQDSSACMSPQAPVREHSVREPQASSLYCPQLHLCFFLDQGSIYYCSHTPLSPLEQCTDYQVSFGLKFLYSNVVIQVAERIAIGCNRISWNIVGIPLKKGLSQEIQG